MRTLRSVLFATGVSLVALSLPALAGPDDPARSGSVAGGAENAPGVTGAVSPSSPADPMAVKSAAEPLALAAPADIDAVPVLKHIASTGAQLLELGEAHGLRSVSARSGDQFMILEIAPDGEAVVGGPELDLSVDKLMTLASGQVKELGQTHGLRGLYLRNGPEFQVL
jgi:thiol:disulfide interchange protein DsbG